MTLLKKPLILMILDGWGYSAETFGNAITADNTPILTSLLNHYPSTFLHVSGESVGLPPGQMGNSEVGHLNIGAGRIVYQDLSRINNSITQHTLEKNAVLLKALNNVKKYNSSLHLMGLFSYGGVHSHINHMQGLIDIAVKEGIKNVYVHAFLDGRDVPPRQALKDMIDYQKNNNGNVIFASICGRYYAMDRDKRWDRTQLAYDALVLGEGFKAQDPITAIQNAYNRGENDEFIKPTVIIDHNGKPLKTIQDNDSVVFFNFRPDRARQLTYAFVNDEFSVFQRKFWPKVYYVCMTEYDEKLKVPLLFPPESFSNTLGHVLSLNGLKQLRIAETEKYAHITFFFNGGVEKQEIGEDRILIPSPKVATYDLQPEMSAYKVTDELIRQIKSEKYDVIIVNYANMDMVGHSGIMEATQEAVKVVDSCVGKIIDVLCEVGGEALITADHGNAEKMVDPVLGVPFTAHTSNLVRFIYVCKNTDVCLKEGKLSDIAPTILQILNIPQPREMTGESLILK